MNIRHCFYIPYDYFTNDLPFGPQHGQSNILNILSKAYGCNL